MKVTQIKSQIKLVDAILDNFLAFDPDAKVACETLVTTGQVILSGEVKSNVYIDVQRVARDVIKEIGYTKSEYKFDSESCGILSMIHEQSEDINRGVDREDSKNQVQVTRELCLDMLQMNQKLYSSSIGNF